ncbi:MAG TPA: hypothetical protein VMX94_10865 [Armatimonadota bacterium]|nr:hypothetical protein [Armatimonadota bacterium]
MDDYGKSSIGFEEGTVAAASYFCFLGLLILIIERRSNFVRFHAIQSTLGFGLLGILWLCVKCAGLSSLAWLPGLLALAFALHMMYKAYHGEEYKFPLIGKLAFSAVYDTSPEPADSPPASGNADESTAADDSRD